MQIVLACQRTPPCAPSAPLHEPRLARARRHAGESVRTEAWRGSPRALTLTLTPTPGGRRAPPPRTRPRRPHALRCPPGEVRRASGSRGAGSTSAGTDRWGAPSSGSDTSEPSTVSAGRLPSVARIRTGDLRDAAATLRRVLDRIASGELTAPAGLTARLEGATAALEAFAGRVRKRS